MTILSDVKKIVSGVSNSDTVFDFELLAYINSSIAILSQCGVEQFNTLVVDELTEWPEILNVRVASASKTFVYLKVKSSFDPQASETITKAINSVTDEMQNRLIYEEGVLV